MATGQVRARTQTLPEGRHRHSRRDATDDRDAMLAPLHRRSRAAPEDDRQDTRRMESEMGGRIGGRLGEVKRDDGDGYSSPILVTIRCGLATFSGVPSLVNFTSNTYFFPDSAGNFPRNLKMLSVGYMPSA